ncbi:hypothetical protein N182_04950 [Sinorhizobium sp. GL2]|nr:hypothetical protein N182_04950 [Sinorhizobium sp. GL2]
MRRVGVEAGVPEQRDGDFGQGDGQREGDEVFAQASGVALRHAGDEVGGADKRQGLGEAADGSGDLAAKAEGLEGSVDRADVVAAARDMDVVAFGLAGGRHFA